MSQNRPEEESQRPGKKALEGSGLSMRWCVVGKATQAVMAAILAGVVWTAVL